MLIKIVRLLTQSIRIRKKQTAFSKCQHYQIPSIYKKEKKGRQLFTGSSASKCQTSIPLTSQFSIEKVDDIFP